MPHRKQRGRPIHGCVMEVPSKDAVCVCGKYVNLHAIARTQNLNVAYVCHILQGRASPSLSCMMKVAGAIGVTLEELVEGIQERKERIAEQKELQFKSYDLRIAAEDREDRLRMESGHPPLARLVGLRLQPEVAVIVKRRRKLLT